MFTSQFDRKRYFKVQSYGLASIGFDLAAPKQIIKNKVFSTVLICATNFHLLLVLHYVLVNLDDLQKVTDALNSFWQGVIALVKITIFIYKRKKVAKLLDHLWKLNAKASPDEIHVIKSANAIDTLVCTIYQVAVLVTAGMAVFVPFLLATIFYASGSGFRLEVPIRGSYFIDTTKLHNYFMVWLLTAINAYNVAHGSIAIDGMFSWFSHNIVAQFQILKLELARVGADNKGNVPMSSLVHFIQMHNQTIETASALNDAYGSIIFLVVTISCGQICCLAYTFSKGGAVADVAFQVVFLGAVTVQIILYCFNGQRIRDESESIGKAIYTALNCYDMDVRHQKLMLIPVMRAQRGSCLRGVFFTVDLNLFLWVFRTAFSFITLLWALDDKNKI